VGRKLAVCFEVRRNRDESSNPTASTGVDRYQTGATQNSSVFTTRATRKTTRFSVRDARYNAAGAMHRVAWALQNSKAIGQICEKPWENQGFAAERTGTEQPTNPLGKSEFQNEAAQNPTRAANTGSARGSARATDPGLKGPGCALGPPRLGPFGTRSPLLSTF
jgi:hypothetical protein